MQFESMTPILRVSDLTAAVDYYTRILGFEAEWVEREIMACVKRGRVRIFLVDGDQGNPGAWLYVGVEDADALHDEYRKSGAKIRNAPTNYSWAYEMQVEDLDGNVLRIGSDPKDDVPFGDWLDMRSVRWRPTRDGGWERVE